MELTELKKLLKLLRDNGVTTYSTSELSLTISEDHTGKAPKVLETSGEVEPQLDSEWEQLSDEEKMLWSAVPTTNS